MSWYSDIIELWYTWESLRRCTSAWHKFFYLIVSSQYVFLVQTWDFCCPKSISNFNEKACSGLAKALISRKLSIPSRKKWYKWIMFVNKEAENTCCIVDRPPTSPYYDLCGAFFHQALRENELSLGSFVFNKLNAFKDGEDKPLLNNFVV